MLIFQMATDLCYQLKINNDENRKLTFKDNTKHDVDGTITCRYGFEKMQKHIWLK